MIHFTTTNAELEQLLAAASAAIARLTARLDRMEERERQTATLVRDIHQDQIRERFNAIQP